MATTIERRLERMERILIADELVEIFGCIVTLRRWQEILETAMSTTLEPNAHLQVTADQET